MATKVLCLDGEGEESWGGGVGSPLFNTCLGGHKHFFPPLTTGVQGGSPASGWLLQGRGAHTQHPAGTQAHSIAQHTSCKYSLQSSYPPGELNCQRGKAGNWLPQHLLTRVSVMVTRLCSNVF